MLHIKEKQRHFQLNDVIIHSVIARCIKTIIHIFAILNAIEDVIFDLKIQKIPTIFIRQSSSVKGLSV